MSIHARLNPEAESNLEAQRRSSVITSVIISLLSVVLVILILFFILLPSLEIGSPVIVTYSAGSEDDDPLEEKRINREVSPKPAAPSSAMAKVKPGVIFSLEMSARQIGGRIVTANTMLEGFALRTGKFGASEYERLKKAEEQLSNLPITIYDDVYSMSEILALTRMLKRSEGVGWMLIDYL